MGWSVREARGAARAAFFLTAATWALIAGCQFEADYGGTSFACAEVEVCPPGFSCRGGVCVSDDAPDAGLGCGGSSATAVLAPGFADDDSLWQRAAEEGAEVGLEAGELVLTLAPQGSSAASLTSLCSLDLAGARVSVEVLAVPERTRLSIEALAPSGEARFAFEIDDDALTMIYEQDGDREQATIAYRPADHRYLAFSEQDGFFVFETSADRTTWLAQRSHPAPQFVSELSLRFAAASSPSGTSGEVRLGDLRAEAIVP
jgi:hypothetical protein